MHAVPDAQHARRRRVPSVHGAEPREVGGARKSRSLAALARCFTCFVAVVPVILSLQRTVLGFLRCAPIPLVGCFLVVQLTVLECLVTVPLRLPHFVTPAHVHFIISFYRIRKLHQSFFRRISVLVCLYVKPQLREWTQQYIPCLSHGVYLALST